MLQQQVKFKGDTCYEQICGSDQGEGRKRMKDSIRNWLHGQVVAIESLSQSSANEWTDPQRLTSGDVVELANAESEVSE